MDIDSIFELFKPNKQSTKDILIDDYIFKVKMFSKLVIKGNVRKDLLIPLVKQINPECDIDDIKKEGEIVLYNRSFLYLEEFCKDDKNWVNAINVCADVFLVTALQICIEYFETTEEYEKCAILFEVLKESLKVIDFHKKKS